MQNELMKLHNTLSTIETKGESTKTMALCLQFVEQLIVRCNTSAEKPAEEVAE